MGCYAIVIPRWHPTPLNTLMAAHWRRRASLKRADRDLVVAYSLLCRVPPANKVRRRVEMTYVRGRGQRGRVPDPDALWKSLLDALVAARVLHDDSYHWVESLPVRFDRAREPATIIELEDI